MDRVRKSVSIYVLPCEFVGPLISNLLRIELLAGLSKSRPIFPPFLSPAYSSVSFTLLGYVLEAVTNKTFAEVIQAEITQPLGMKYTGFEPSNETSWVIPPVMNTWGANFMDNNP